MTNKRYLWPWALVTAMLLLALSCGGNDDNDLPPTDDPGSNTTPVANDATVSVDEDITDTETIIKVDAEDADGDPLSYAITTNDLELFEVDTDGAISLAAGKTLDHGNKPQHQIKVTVSDGKAGSDIANITINVNAVQGGDLPNSAPELTNNEYDIPENVEAGITLVSLEAVDEDEGDTLTFSLTADESGLFALSESGELSLIAGGELDHETVDTYTVSLEIGDGTTTVEADIILNITDVNEAPVFTGETTEFEVEENIATDVIILELTAADPEEDMLQFSIIQNANGLFEIDPQQGKLSLADDKELDFETTEGDYVIQIGISDSQIETVIELTITVLDDMLLADDPASFVTKWTTQQNGQSIVIPMSGENFTVDWGDGTSEDVTLTGDIEHQYAIAGTYVVAIKGQLNAIRMYQGTEENAELLSSIEQWGDSQWTNMFFAFNDCSNLKYKASDVPDLSNLNNLSGMFSGCTMFNGDLSEWNVDNVYNMQLMFWEASSFNGDISVWNVQNVQSTTRMFGYAFSFNRDLSNWKVSNVQSMFEMFAGASDFDQDLSSWNLSSLTNATDMLNNSGLSQENYEATLIGWAEADTTPDNVTLGAVGLTYCSDAAKAARNEVLIAQKGWTINGDTEDCN